MNNRGAAVQAAVDPMPAVVALAASRFHVSPRVSPVTVCVSSLTGVGVQDVGRVPAAPLAPHSIGVFLHKLHLLSLHLDRES